DPVDQLDRYDRWYREGYRSSTGRCFDIGNTVRTALERYEKTRQPFDAPSGPNDAGNGSLMRLAPVPLFYARRPELAIHYAAESSRVTHAATEAIDACRYFAALLIGAVSGTSKEEILSDRYAPSTFRWTDPLSSSIQRVASGSFKNKNREEIRSTGYVVDSLEAALWAFQWSTSFEEGCRLAANLGGDADTVAAIYGQLAGAFYGIEGIPVRWRGVLAHRDWLENAARRLYATAHR
ncbi:MAG: ADP-ribosylglycohydrolase family protein, partial [Thermoanaerobaculia bacterium]